MTAKSSYQSIQESLGTTEVGAKLEPADDAVRRIHQTALDHSPSTPKLESPFIIITPSFRTEDTSAAFRTEELGSAANAVKEVNRTSITGSFLNVKSAGLYSASVKAPIVMPVSKSRSKLLQQWEGVVVDIRDDKFDAILRDTTALHRQQRDERATFSFEEISSDDLKLVVRGAVFYWSIGYEISEHGERTLTASLRFRRLPGWSKSEIEAINKEAEELAHAFGIYEPTKNTAKL